MRDLLCCGSLLARNSQASWMDSDEGASQIIAVQMVFHTIFMMPQVQNKELLTSLLAEQNPRSLFVTYNSSKDSKTNLRGNFILEILMSTFTSPCNL